MAVKKKQDLIEQLKAKFGEDTGDDVLSILEDVTDTITELEQQVEESGSWKQKAEDIEKTWRKKYADRFSGLTEKEEKQEEQTPPPNSETPDDGPTRYEDLFTVAETK